MTLVAPTTVVVKMALTSNCKRYIRIVENCILESMSAACVWFVSGKSLLRLWVTSSTSLLSKYTGLHHLLWFGWPSTSNSIVKETSGLFPGSLHKNYKGTPTV